MEKKRKSLLAVCICGLLVLTLGACDGLEFGSYGRGNAVPLYDLPEEEDDSEDEEEGEHVTHVEGITLDDDSAHHLLNVGDSLVLNATVTPSDADNQNVIWNITPAPIESSEEPTTDDEPAETSVKFYDGTDDGNDGDQDGGDTGGNTGDTGQGGDEGGTGGDGEGDDTGEGGDTEDPDDDSEDKESLPEGEPEYTISNERVELVSYGNSALITALSSGYSTVTATSEDGGYSASTEINVVSEDDIYNDYVVNFDLAEGVEVPSYGELWLAVDGIDGFFTLVYDEESGLYSVSIGAQTQRETIYYHIYLVYESHYYELENCPQYTTELEVGLLYGGLIIDESYTGNEVTDTIISMPNLPAPEDTYDEINIELTIYSDDGCHTPTEIPEGIDVYLEWSSDEWETTHEAYVDGDGLLTRVEGTTSTFTFTFLGEGFVSSQGEIEYEIFYEVATEKPEEEEQEENENDEENIDETHLKYLDDDDQSEYPSSDEQGDEEIEKVEITHSFSGGKGFFTVPYFYDGYLTVSFCDYNRATRADDYFFGTDFYVLFVDIGGYSLESLVTKNETSSTYEPNMYVVMSSNESFINQDITYGDTCIAYSAAFVPAGVCEECTYYDGYGCIYCDGSARHIIGETDTFTVAFSNGTSVVTLSTGSIEIPERTDADKDLVYICFVDFTGSDTPTTGTGVWVEVDDYTGLFTAIEIEEDDPYMDGNQGSDNDGN
ncbi:MAG: hypothetical protein LUC16_01785 [Coprobacillus sp.]|nr:hypothetical protein [Coprobacillus sp.]